MRSIHAKVVGLLCGVASLAAVSSASAKANPLRLENGWVAGSSGRIPGATKVGDIVYLQGAMANPSTKSMKPFKLPPVDRPVSDVWVNVDLPCVSTSARLYIAATGDVTVDAYSGSKNALCGVSLDGVSFSTTAFAGAVALQGTWTTYPNTFVPAADNLNGITHLQGGMYNGTGLPAFTLKPALAPIATVDVNTNLYDDDPGYLGIGSDGTVGPQSVIVNSATDFTSLEGVVFANKSLSTALVLENGWTAYSGFATPAVEEINGVVYLQGAIYGGSNTIAQLPSNLVPSEDVRMQVVAYSGYSAELHVDVLGNITVSSENAFPSSYLSLDGAYFVLASTP